VVRGCPRFWERAEKLTQTLIEVLKENGLFSNKTKIDGKLLQSKESSEQSPQAGLDDSSKPRGLSM
jgi:hypothetical protein